MSLDAQFASRVAGGESFVPAPVDIVGLHVEPPIETLCSQATGVGGAVVLRARLTSGRIRMFDRVLDYAGDEDILASQTSYEDQAQTAFASGQAQWFTAVAVRIRKSSEIQILWIPGVIAAVASATVRSMDSIIAFLGLESGDDGAPEIVILGDIRFYRSGDLTIEVQTTAGRRPAFVDTTRKTTVTEDANDPNGMEEVDAGWLDLPITLASAFALNAGDLYHAVPAPRFAYGGRIFGWSYLGAVSGGGAGADMTLKIQIGGVVVTGSDLQLLLANTAIAAGGTVVSAAPSALNIFEPGQTIGVEVDAKPTAFTAGSGILRIYMRRFVPVRP